MSFSFGSLSPFFQCCSSSCDQPLDTIHSVTIPQSLKGRDVPTRAKDYFVEGSVVRPDGGRYKGQMRDGVPQGRGIFRYSNGDFYDGLWVGGRACGEGTFLKSDGRKYTGQWKNDVKDGVDRSNARVPNDPGQVLIVAEKDHEVRSGRENSPDGSQFYGQFSKGFREGRGVFRRTDGTCYSGAFENDFMHGKGSMKFPDGRVYVGQWQLSEMDGQGEMTWPDGRKFVGKFRNGIISNKGEYSVPKTPRTAAAASKSPVVDWGDFYDRKTNVRAVLIPKQSLVLNEDRVT